MVKCWNKVPLKTSMHIRILHQEYGYRVCKIKEKYPKIPTRTIAYHAKLDQSSETTDRRHNNPGRPRKLNDRDCRRIRSKVVALRSFDSCNFSAVKLKKVCDLDNVCSTRTVARIMKDAGYHFLNTRQKGLMNKKDHKLRVQFAKKAIEQIGPSLWVERLSFFYDGVTFYHKTNPYGEAVAPKAKLWRKRSEGMSMSRKGKKEGNNARSVKLFVAIAYNKGVVMCEQWNPEVRFLGVNYKEFVKRHWPAALENSTNPKNKLVLQDGCPVQKSKQANLAYDELGVKIFNIPARSPDMNPIENIFHLVR